MPRLSIVIPVLCSSARLETTLVSVLENRPPDCEIIVVLGAPYADPYDLAGEVRFSQLPSSTSLVTGVNEGIEISQAPIVHILAAGLEVTEGWCEAALTHFSEQDVASVAPMIADVLDIQRPIAAGLDYSPSRGRIVRIDRTTVGALSPAADASKSADVLGPLSLAAFFRRSAVQLAGGLPDCVGDDYADADVSLSLRFAGYRSVFEPRCIVVGHRGDVAQPRQGFRQGLAAERLFWRAAPVVGWVKSIAGHSLAVPVQFLGALPRPGAMASLAGRLLAACQIRSHRDHYQWLLDLRRTATALFNGARPQQRMRLDGPHEPSRPVQAREAKVAAHLT